MERSFMIAVLEKEGDSPNKSGGGHLVASGGPWLLLLPLVSMHHTPLFLSSFWLFSLISIADMSSSTQTFSDSVPQCFEPLISSCILFSWVDLFSHDFSYNLYINDSRILWRCLLNPISHSTYISLSISAETIQPTLGSLSSWPPPGFPVTVDSTMICLFVLDVLDFSPHSPHPSIHPI